MWVKSLEIVDKEVVVEYYLGWRFVVCARVWVACSWLLGCGIHVKGDLRVFGALMSN
jgi:hypothetical protein